MKILKIGEDFIEFNNGTILNYYHNQDCCENVYADFESIKDTSAMSHDFKDQVNIEKVEGSGFRIEGYFIPCYNEQNGYYSSELDLIVLYPNGDEEIIDISECVEDHIC